MRAEGRIVVRKASPARLCVDHYGVNNSEFG